MVWQPDNKCYSKRQESNMKSSIVRTRRIWGALYDEEIELQVSQDEYDNQIFKK